MPRKRKYDTDILLQMIEEYLNIKSDYQPLTFVDLASYCQKTYPQMSNINYQDFSRNREIKTYIEDYNNRIEQRLMDINAVESIAQDRLLDARQFYGKSESEINNIVAECNKYLSGVFRQNRRLYKLFYTSKEEASLLKRKIQDLDFQKEKATADNTKLRQDLVSVRKELATVKQQNKMLKAYIEKNIYDPVIQNHLVEIGWLSSTGDIGASHGQIEEGTLETIVAENVLTQSESKTLAALNALMEE